MTKGKTAKSAPIKRGRGILPRKSGAKALVEEWKEHIKREKELEGRNAR